MRYSSTFRPCWRQVATTVSIRSTNRLPRSLVGPAADLPPEHRMPQAPAPPRCSSAPRPSTRRKVHRCASPASSSRQVAAVLCTSTPPRAAGPDARRTATGPCSPATSRRAIVPSRTRCHQWNSLSECSSNRPPTLGRLAAAVDHRLEIATEMRPAELPRPRSSRSWEPVADDDLAGRRRRGSAGPPRRPRSRRW